MNRRQFTLAAAATLMARPLLAQGTAAPVVEVYKSPTCGCCNAWIAHMQEAGFELRARDLRQDALNQLKAQAGITRALASCHTAFAGGYFIEGHVPAADVRRLLAEAPDALGLTVPGMPVGSPGMEMGDQRDPFDTLLVRPGGATEIFQSYS